MKKICILLITSILLCTFEMNVYANNMSEKNEINKQDERMICESYSRNFYGDKSVRSFVRNANVEWNILNPDTDEWLASVTWNVEYEYADGLWAKINNVNIKHKHLSTYYITEPYDEHLSMDSESGTYAYYADLLHNGRRVIYYFYFTCSIYGDVDAGMICCGVQ